MNPSESPSPAASYLGHVKDGVVILDTQASLQDGQAVRIELLGQGSQALDADHTDRVRRLPQVFAEWTEEDAKLADEEADRLRAALEQDRGLRFRPAAPD